MTSWGPFLESFCDLGVFVTDVFHRFCRTSRLEIGRFDPFLKFLEPQQ